MESQITIKEAITKRKSTRSFDMNGLSKEELAEITEYVNTIPELVSGTKIKAEIIGSNDVKSIMKWRAPHYFAIYAEDSDAGRMSVGYIYEQVVLYMTSLGIGSCWATSLSPLEKHEDDGTKWIAVIAFGKPLGESAFRENEGKRKSITEITDKPDELIEVARLAPSSMNNQPWYFEHKGNDILVYCKKQGILKKWMISQNRIDIGIALGNIKVVSDNFSFSLADNQTEKNGYTLMGTISF